MGTDNNKSNRNKATDMKNRIGLEKDHMKEDKNPAVGTKERISKSSSSSSSNSSKGFGLKKTL